MGMIILGTVGIMMLIAVFIVSFAELVLEYKGY